jgi:hypothetical protein
MKTLTLALLGALLWLPLISGQTLTRPTVVGPHSCVQQVWRQQPGIAPPTFYWQTWQLWNQPCPGESPLWFPPSQIWPPVPPPA